MDEPQNEGEKVVYHTQIPMDLAKLECFIPYDILNQVPPDEREKFISEKVRDLVANFMIQHIQPRIIIHEGRAQRLQADGITRIGKLFIAELAIGRNTMLKTADGRDITNIDKQPIVVGNN